MVVNNKLNQKTIESIIENVEAGNFRLPKRLRDVPPPMGYSSPKVRDLLNRLVSLNTSKMTYLEIGVHTGSTFFAAIHGNRSRAVAIDNWSLDECFLPDGGAKQYFMRQLDELRPEPVDLRIGYIESDAFSVDLDAIPKPVTVYFYDGNHNRESQYKALTYYAPVLADRFVYVVDDFNWAEPRDETYHALRDLHYTIENEWYLHSVGDRDMERWWNGLFVGIITK